MNRQCSFGNMMSTKLKFCRRLPWNRTRSFDWLRDIVFGTMYGWLAYLCHAWIKYFVVAFTDAFCKKEKEIQPYKQQKMGSLEVPYHRSNNSTRKLAIWNFWGYFVHLLSVSRTQCFISFVKRGRFLLPYPLLQYFTLADIVSLL